MAKPHFPRNDPITNELLAALGIPKDSAVTEVQFSMKVGNITSIKVEMYATEDQADQLAKVFKKYVIMEEEDLG